MHLVFATCTPEVPRLSGLMRDLATGFRQQMFFWGKDVMHPQGNLLRQQGFERLPTPGLLQGTSCYRLPWENGMLELHGTCAGWYPQNGEGGFLFIRPAGRCLLWLGKLPPVPGEWTPTLMEQASPQALHEAARPFLRWWLASEAWIEAEAGDDYRSQCFRHFRKLPKSRGWLPPKASTAWICGLLDNPVSLARARRFVPAKL